MSLTRKMLRAMDIDEEKITQIIEAHQSVVEEIAGERDTLKEKVENHKAESEELAKLKKEVETLRAKADESEELSKKYKTLQDEYNTFKDDVKEKDVKALKDKAYRNLLKEAGITESRFDTIMKVTDLSKVELDESGNAKNKDSILEGINAEWADFKQTETKEGAKTPNPPGKVAKSFTRDDIRKMSASEINQNWETIKNSLNQI